MSEESKSAQEGRATTQETTPAASSELLSQILDEFGEGQHDRLRDELGEYIETITRGTVVAEDSIKAIDAEIARIDQLLSAQVNEILHSPKYQKLEAAWRGLHYLVHQSETGDQLRIKVINVTKRELLKDLQDASEFDQSSMFKRIYEEEFGMAGGSPIGAILGDIEFDMKHPEDMTILEGMAGIAASAHAPFIASASPEAFSMKSFEQLADKRDLSEIFNEKLNPEYARWAVFRKEWDDSRFVGLCLPRILLRLPYGEKTDRVDLFRFEEDTDGSDHAKYLWGNAAWALAARMTDAFAKYGWCANITGREGGGTVEGLPLHTFKTDTGEIAAKCPTEVAITDRRDHELDKLGFVPLCHYKDTNYAVFFAAHSAQKPRKYDDPDAQANAELSVHLTYMMAISRFAHYMKAILRDKLGTFTEASDLESFLNRWFAQYTLDNPESAGPRLKAEKPLREFKVTVRSLAEKGKPGHYEADLHVRPHYQLQDIKMSLHLVSNVNR